ncbi:MAG: LptF/LptG family permease [Armatimonadota bacterium]|nr:LptF/LptG family permease [Armatimonadota bacterium]
MRLVDRLILRELIGPFIFGVAAFASIFFAGKDLLKIIGDVVKGMPITAAVELIALQFPAILVMVLPMAVLLAVLLALGRLSGESEIITLYAGGISLYRIVVAVFGLGIAVSVLTFVLNENIVPQANARSAAIRADLLKEDVRVSKPVPLADVKKGVTNSIIYVQGGMDVKTKTLKNVHVMLFRDNIAKAFFYAKTAQYERSRNGDYVWKFHNGYSQSLGPNRESKGQAKHFLVLTQTFGSMDVKFNHTPEEIEIYQKQAEELNFNQLLGHIRLLHSRGMPTTEEELDLYNKIAIPFSAFVFAVLASSLGLRPHRGGSSVGLGLSVLIIFVYWIVWHSMSAFANQGTVPPIVGSFSASALTLVAGFTLLAKAAR